MKYAEYGREYHVEQTKRWQAERDWTSLLGAMHAILSGDLDAPTRQDPVALTTRCEGAVDFQRLIKSFTHRGDGRWDFTGLDFGWLVTQEHFCNAFDNAGSQGIVCIQNSYHFLNFAYATFRAALFHGCTFRNCVFFAAVFDRVIFDDCSFIACDFNRSELRKPKFSGKFFNCEFRDVALEACEIDSTDIAGCRWNGAALNSHCGALRFSEAVLQSIAFSNYQLASAIRNHNTDPSQQRFGSLFLSHNTEDKEFVRRLAGDLARNGVRVWVDEAEIRIGDSLIERIEEGILGSDYLGVVLSPSSVNSRWVKKELRIALGEEIGGRGIQVFPLLLADCEIPLFLREKLYADFRKEERYHEGLGRIMDALRQCK